ncbi:hypothetical protein Tco_1066782, partial [Tanacetum coccineum]
KTHWVKWNSVLSSREKGGLDIGSLEAFTKVLLYKWKWRLCIDTNVLWVKIIKSVHGDYVGFITSRASDFKQKGVWRSIVGTINNLHVKNIFPVNSISKRVGDGLITKFWKDIWIGDTPLMYSFPRLFSLELDQDCLIANHWVDNKGSWQWRHAVLRGASFSQLF